MKDKLELSIALWKYAKEWVYSASYDEALSDLYRYVIPTHDRLGIPGHVEVVSGHIGIIRNIGASSFNGMKHMDKDELLDIMSRGWGSRLSFLEPRNGNGKPGEGAPSGKRRA